MEAGMKWVLAVWTMASVMFCAGCIGPHYTNKQLIVSGKLPPPIRGPRDPAIEANLSTHPWPKTPFPGRATDVVVALFKSMGIQGWKDYHLHAKARGEVINHEFSSSGFLTLDIGLMSLTINNVSIPLRGPRYMRFEIFLGKVSVDKAIYTETNAMVLGRGKFVWDSDGWFEIHPQKTGDVGLSPPL